MLYSQNRELYRACDDGNVSRVSELISKGAQVNYHNPDPGYSNVSIVSGHMMLVTDPHISIYYHTHFCSALMTPDQINFMNIIGDIATVRITNCLIKECLSTESTLVDMTLLVCPSLTTVPLTSKWTNTRGRLAGNPGVILSCPRNRVSLIAGRYEYRVHHALVRIRACTVYARKSHTTTT